MNIYCVVVVGALLPIWFNRGCIRIAHPLHSHNRGRVYYYPEFYVEWPGSDLFGEQLLERHSGMLRAWNAGRWGDTFLMT